jgi:hypothetical protein
MRQKTGSGKVGKEQGRRTGSSKRTNARPPRIIDSDNGGYQARIGFPDHFGGGSPARKPQEMRWPKIAQTPEIPMSRFIDCCRSKNECVTRMRLETKFVRLKTSVKIGSRFGEWKVCWLGGWIRDLLHTS